MLLHSMMFGIRDEEDLMSVNDLLNLLNKLRKNDKMRGLLNILSLFWNELNKFNTTGTQDSIFHMTLILLKIAYWRKKSRLYHFVRMQ